MNEKLQKCKFCNQISPKSKWITYRNQTYEYVAEICPNCKKQCMAYDIEEMWLKQPHADKE